MQNAMTIGKRAFTTAVAAATILWSVSAGALVAPLSASATTTLADGDLIKGSLSTVYLYTGGERFTFPNEKTYFSWYENYDSVMTVSDSQLSGYPLAGNVVVRPGTWMVKVDTDPKTYVVTRGGGIRWVETEDVAMDLYGANWNQWVIDVPDVFFTDFSEESSMMTAEFVDGMQVEGSNYIIWDGEKRMVTSAGMSANRLQSRFVIMDSSVALGDYATGSEIDGEVPALSDASQQATGDVVSEGGLSVSLSSDSPSGQTIPAGATNVALMGVKLMANDADVSVSNAVFHFTGVADVSVFDNLYVYWNGQRLTNGKTINSTTRDVTFSSLDIEIAQGDTETVWLTGDIDTGSFGSAGVSFELESEDSVTSTASSISGSFPVASHSNTLTDAASVGTVTINETGSISDVTIGEQEAEIAKFTIAGQDEDAMIEALTLNVDKADDHMDYQLWQSTTLIADGESIGNDLVLFSFDDAYTILDGNTKTFTVTATIGGDPNDEIHTSLEESSDLTAIGGDFGFGMLVTNNYGDDSSSTCLTSADDCSFATIIGGKLTFAMNGPSSANDLQIGGDNQDIMDFTLTSQNAATLNSIEFDITGTNFCDGSSDANYENFEIIDENGTVLMGPEEFTTCVSASSDETAQTLVFNDEFDMVAGTSMELSLVADILDTGTAASGNTILATMDSSETSAEDDQGNDLTVGTDIIPLANLIGNTFTLTNASLTINLAGTPSSASVVKGTDGVDMVGFSFTAGEASDILVSDATFHVLVDSDGNDTFDEAGDITALAAQDHIETCSLYDGDGVLIDGPESVDSDANVSFSGFDWTIASSGTELLVVNCDLANVAVVATPDDYAVEIALNTDVTAEDADGDEITPTLTDGNTTDTIEIGVTAAGTLTTALGGDSPDADIVIGSSSNIEVGVYRFTSTVEAFTVNEITVANGGTAAAVGNVYLTYEDSDGETVTASSVFAGSSATFDGLDLYVPADDTADVTVTVDTASVSNSGGAASGNTIVITLDADTVQYTGLSSQTTTTDAGTDATASIFTLRKTRPTLAIASGSPSGEGIPGLNEVLRFNLSADSHGYVVLDELTFKMTSTDNGGESNPDWNECGSSSPNMAVADFSFYNVDNLSDDLEGSDSDWTVLDSAGAACASNTDLTFIVLDLTSSITIDAGTTETYALYADTTGAATGTSGDSVRFEIPRDSDVASLGGATDPDGSIIWDDANMTAGVDLDGTSIDTLPLPTSGGTIIY